MDNRQHYTEINTLMATVAKALQIDAAQAATEMERGMITLRLDEDERGRFIEAVRDERMVRVYQGAVLYPPGAEPLDGAG